MKKIILIILLLCMSGCISNEQDLVCSTISQDESTKITLTYTYGNDKKITKVHKMIRVSFNENSLEKKSLDEMYKKVQSEYLKYQKIDGLQCTILINRKEKNIELNIQVDLLKYDFKDDLFSLGSKKDYENITKIIDDITNLGYYRCQEKGK